MCSPESVPGIFLIKEGKDKFLNNSMFCCNLFLKRLN